jgi:hypothetical protein
VCDSYFDILTKLRRVSQSWSQLRPGSMNACVIMPGTRAMRRFFYATLPTVVSIAAASAAAAFDGGVAVERITSMTKSEPERIAQNRSEPLPLPRDPEIAVREEFDAARARGTAESWDLFIARHPGHRLAGDARKELEKLRQKPNP